MKRLFSALLSALVVFIAPRTASAQSVTTILADRFIGGTFTGTSITNTGLTATRVPFSGTGGVLTDNAALTFASGTGILTATGLTLNAPNASVMSTGNIYIDGSGGGSVNLRVAGFVSSLTVDPTTGVVNIATPGLTSLGTVTAPLFSGPLTGNASTATTATNFNNGTSSSSGGTITATTFLGALSGNASTATTAGTVTTAAQPNITSVGMLTSLGTSGNIVYTGSFNSAENISVINTANTASAAAIFKATVGGTSANKSSIQFSDGTTIIEAGMLAGSPRFRVGLTDIGGGTTILGAQANGVTFNNLLDGGDHLIISGTAPTIASGFGTSPSILANNTAAFQVTVGTGGTDSQGTLTFPTAPNGWACNAQYTAVQALGYIEQIAVVNTTQVLVTNVHATTGLGVAWPAGTTIQFQCTAF